jgi:hypothetical protein
VIHRATRLARPLLALAAALLAACGGGGATPDKTYTITLRFCSTSNFASCTSDPGNASDVEITPDQRAAFETARDRVQGLITAGLVPARTRDSSGPLDCSDGTMAVTLDQTVHGLLLLVVVKDTGATSGTLASSGPCIERVSSHLPLVALTEFNSNYIPGLVTRGQLETVITHEMLHTLGFGTVWIDFHPPLITGRYTTSSAFTGPRACQAAIADNSAPSTWTTVPLENGGQDADPTCYTPGPSYNPSGPTCWTGSRDSHWDINAFGNELMTYRIPAAGTSSPLSATTIASLADMGYAVDMTKAQDFSVNTSGLRALRSEPGLDLSNDVLDIPVQYADDLTPAP